MGYLRLAATWSTNIKRVENKVAQRPVMLALLLERRSGMSISTLFCFVSNRSVVRWTMFALSVSPLSAAHPVITSELAFWLSQPDTLETSQSTRIWRFSFKPTTSQHKIRFSTHHPSSVTWKTLVPTEGWNKSPELSRKRLKISKARRGRSLEGSHVNRSKFATLSDYSE